MWKLIRFLKGYKREVIFGPLSKLLEALFELIVPLVVARIIDIGIKDANIPYILKMGAVLLGLGAAGLGFSLTCQYLAARASQGFGTNVRRDLYSHINSLSYNELDQIGIPSLITRITSDVNQAQNAVAMTIRLVMRAPFIVIGSIIMAMLIDVKLSLIFIVAGIIVSIVLFVIMSSSVPYYRKIQKKLDNVSLLTRENLLGARVVRAFSNQQEEEEDFAVAANELSKASVKVGKISALLNPLTYAIINIAVMAILWLGGKGVYYGNLSQGQIIALVNYLSQILLSLVVIANLVVIFTKASACAARINEVFDTKPSITDNDNKTIEKKENSVKLQFDNVSFAYNDNKGYSLDKINFTLDIGQTLGIIGSTGSGKSTLINLIPRFYDASIGAINVDGVNVKDYPLNQLRKKVGLVPQSAVLFYGTIRENLQWGKADATDMEIAKALKIAQAADFVDALHDGYDHMIMQGGKNLSGGQKQRLTIARAIVGNPEILILDDSSSALDYETDSNLRKALKEINTTVIMISQRATSIKFADNILVLDEGAIAGYGTHKELFETCKVYREICSSQSGAEDMI